MSDPASFREIIDLWPTREAMADEISEVSGLKASGWMVSKWWQRNTIPPEWWSAVLGCPRIRDGGISGDNLISLAARPPAEPVEARA